MSEWKLESLTVKPTEPAVAPDRLISDHHCVNCGHAYFDHLVGMNTVQTGQCRLCQCFEAETASKDRLWEDHADLTAKLKLAVEALEHYGNPDTYSDGFHKFGCDAPNIATDALKQIGEQR